MRFPLAGASLRVIPILIVLAVPGVPLEGASAGEADAAVSGIGLDGARCEVRIETPGQSGRFPDLSRPGETRIPGGAFLELGVPVLWAGRVVIASGEYRISIVVDEDREVHLALVGPGGILRVPVDRGDLFEPGEGITLALTRVRQGDQDRGHFLLRWGALLLLGSFERLPQRTLQAGGWRLRHYSYPDEITLDAELPLGQLERVEGAKSPRQLTLRPGVAAEPRLLVEDAELAELRGEKESLQRELGALRRRVRRASPEDEPRLQRQVKNLETRLRALIERLEGQTTTATSYVLEGKPVGSEKPPRIVVSLAEEDGSPILRVSHPGGTFVFFLREG